MKDGKLRKILEIPANDGIMCNNCQTFAGTIEWDWRAPMHCFSTCYSSLVCAVWCRESESIRRKEEGKEKESESQ